MKRKTRRTIAYPRFAMLITAIILFISATTGCLQANRQVAEEPDNTLRVVATIFAPYDFAREIAGDRADITMLLPPAAESHSYEPTPQDIIKIQNCDMFIYVGGESESWVDRVLSSMDTDGIKIVSLMDCVDVVDEEIVEGMEEDEQDEGKVYDEHVWTAPANAIQIVRKLSDTFYEIDGANVSFYEQNRNDYVKKLEELDRSFQAVVDGAARKTIVFGDRFPFRYFADAYGLDYFAAFPGCAAETEASAPTITFLIDKVKAEGIPVVFHAELSNRKMADTISEATGAEVRLLHACHGISKADFTSGASYLDLMTRNIEALREAIQ